MPDSGIASGSALNEEPGDRGPLTLPEILGAHKAFKMAAAGFVEKPRGVSRARWEAACDLAEDVIPGICWMLGHLGGDAGRSLDLIVRTAGDMTGGLPLPGPEDVPPLYLSMYAPPTCCRVCGVSHRDELPHEISPLFQMQFYSRYGRRANHADACAHCSEPVQAVYAAFWNRVGCWPTVPHGWSAPPWFGAAVQELFQTLQRHVKQ